MIIAVERSKFNIIYKYNQIVIGLGSVLDNDLKELEIRANSQNRFDSLVKEFDRILPIFELDHEVLLLEVDKAAVGLSNELVVYFNSIQNIYPLTSDGEKLLWGKISENIRVQAPIFEKVINQVKATRAIRLRVTSAKKLLDIFGLVRPADSKFKQTLHSALETYIYKGKVENSILAHLITYDKTPNYLPSGNAEFITKVGVITLRSLDKDETIIRNGELYKKSVAFKESINRGTFIDGLQNFYKLLKDDDLKSSYDKVVDSISPKFDGLDIFKISYYFLAIKTVLNKTEKDFVSIAHLIERESKKDPNTFVHVLLLVGYSFSFEDLYESIHTLEHAPVLKRIYKNYQETNPKAPSSSNYDTTEQFEGVEKDNLSEKIEDGQSQVNEDSGKNNKREVTLYENKNEFQNMGELPIVSENKVLINQYPKSVQKSEGVTVRNFSEWISTKVSAKGKLKIWRAFIQINFPVKDELLSLDALNHALEKFNRGDELFTKNGKAKFDKNSIAKEFFKVG